jgi:hypothetical protein
MHTCIPWLSRSPAQLKKAAQPSSKRQTWQLLPQQPALCSYLNQQWQRAAVNNLPLVVVIFEGQRPQGSCCCALHLQIPAIEQPNQGRDASISAHLQEKIIRTCVK